MNFTQTTWAVPKIPVYTSYTHHYEWLLRKNDVWLEYRLNESNKLQLTESELLIVQPYQTRKYLLKNLKKVELHFKRLALPIVLGGIICPLSVLALYNYLIGFWIGIMLAFFSALLFYYGWVGTYQVALELKHTKINFLTDQHTLLLEQFITETNQMIIKRNNV